jgi:hypothetical protein
MRKIKLRSETLFDNLMYVKAPNKTRATKKGSQFATGPILKGDIFRKHESTFQFWTLKSQSFNYNLEKYIIFGTSHASIQPFDEVQLMWYTGGGADLQAARFGTSQPAKSRITKDDMRRVGKYFGINNVTR